MGIEHKIDSELYRVLSQSNFNKIDYNTLLVHDPIQIRREEKRRNGFITKRRASCHSQTA
ncbi:hypothetical protein [Chryseobacterium populi]|uniref:hypothetical protein n=1 Tax=Chryseobacterium populi TaxID=1144316 RepID=UPI000AF7E006|nr:hypothetical protein [Chryseobacterium populi]